MMTLILLMLGMLSATPMFVSDGAIVPQPKRPGCTSCSVGENVKANLEDALTLTLTETYLGQIQGLVLIAHDDDGEESQFRLFADTRSQQTQTFLLRLPDDTVRTSLEFELKGGSHFIEPIPFYPAP